ncbi:hypothetical protein SHELI_v1c07570 [Spiroplasma helicoides]|uniref:Uncharacterized protein n=1 Tax=Spiroplasma helicoides TaxID=216938 RepID=A0A1B3SL96_9MOLU|nr:hypothetical protein [Spiroplasma helicoides]AOG60706.1 hypothetical protein SHELI_v1c07570 [Spiroplasma helicoides]
MKKWLKMLFGLKINIHPLNELYKYTESSLSKHRLFLRDNEIDLYFKYDMNYQGTVEEFVISNLDLIIKNNLHDYELGKVIYSLANYEFVSYEDFKLTLKFSDKENRYCLGKSITKTFDVFLYNYDNVTKIQEEILRSNKIILPSDIKYMDGIVDYLESTFKESFNKACSDKIFLNNEKDFFDYLNFYEIDDNGNLKAQFLGSNTIYFPLYQDIPQ